METYNVDYAWAWGTRRTGDPITLRAHFRFASEDIAKRATREFFDALMREHGFHGAGGWAAELAGSRQAERAIDFTAGGEDVADAIGYAAEDAVEHFSRYPGTTVSWEQQPY
ncbi:hypothetical protein [Corynebacterium liangguodongii]|uniref:Uncharacterized protein n=1 Tax=Corynebacterium liangguodongii TaxID=2079535 RepID=A0A2S0WCZ7_9CORY|nr:hypothetical protein [Corynebacterium liangguodongii]AWB83630.1 hypothetical protein C3E79_03295 [Corynebacterium liangguodongii]PWB99561.1 hypothetical protein DF219_06500 [Corynebacterium liangguodongii]